MISHDRALFLITLSQVCEERAVSDSPLRLSRNPVAQLGGNRVFSTYSGK